MAQRRAESPHNHTAQNDEVRESSLSPIVWKGSREFRHDLFKLDIQEMKKNVSYKKYQPDLQRVEHVHFFHSVDMKGKPLKYSAAVGGHFHEVTTETDRNGNISAKCGPALRSIQKKLKNGKVKTVIEKVKFATADLSEEVAEEDTEEIRFLYDDHVHEVAYVHSEMISPDKLRQKQSADSVKLSQMMKSDPNVAQGAQPAKPASANDEGGDVGEASLKEE